MLPHALDEGARPQSYCLLLLSEVTVNREELLALPEKCDVEELVTNLLEYLDTDGKQRRGPLPTWEEFRDLVDDYEVTVRGKDPLRDRTGYSTIRWNRVLQIGPQP